MSKPLIIIADTNELYLQNLERKFLEEFDDQIELEIIRQDFKDITFPICVCWQKNMRVEVRRICL